ncbi:hypothetical protein QGN29_14355 [Temperatibacter marinus]|uniref:Uncharacterized protein n=1 Tax=Temperatibacter marinus TaxID=1456591 RepID=A0AA52EDJ5_9PROT|nr:hypothetical protein [Temperatibacter marinus]WND02730.1 hypothetical protein QGN29_14355 [Temperatibacter marinus]
MRASVWSEFCANNLCQNAHLEGSSSIWRVSMPSLNYLYRRNAVYYFRKVILCGGEKIELRLSLKTYCKTLAKSISDYLVVFIEEKSVVELKGRGNFLTSEQRIEAFKDVVSFERDRLLNQFQAELKMSDDNEATLQEYISQNNQWRTIHSALPSLFKYEGNPEINSSELRGELSSQMIASQLDTRGVAARYRDQILDQFELLKTSSVRNDVWKLVCEAIAEAVLQANLNVLGEEIDKPHKVEKYSIQTQLSTESRPELEQLPDQKNIAPRIKLLERFLTFEEDQVSGGQWGNKGGKDYKTAIVRYTEIYPDDTVADVTQEKLSNFLKCLENKEKKKGFVVGQMPSALKGDGLSINKINGSITALKMLLTDDRKKGYIVPTIEWDLLKTTKRDYRSTKERTEYILVSDATKLFSTTIYTGSRGEKIDGPKKVSPRFEAGRAIYQDAAYWVPLLLWYSGMRPSEACGLMTSDFLETSGTLCVVIRSNLMGNIKKKTSLRVIPVHPELVRLGFKEFVLATHMAGRRALFPELIPTSRTTATGDVFNRLIWTKMRPKLFGDMKYPEMTLGGFRHSVETLVGRVKIDGRHIESRHVAEFLGRNDNKTTLGDVVYNAGGYMPVLNDINAVIPIVTSHLKLVPIKLISNANMIGRSESLGDNDFHPLPNRDFWSRAHLEMMDANAADFERYMKKHDLDLLCM